MVGYAVAVAVEQGQQLPGQLDGIAAWHQAPQPPEVRTCLTEDRGQQAATIVTAFEQTLVPAQQQTHLGDGGVRVGHGEHAGNGLAQPVQLARQRPHLVPLDIPVCPVQGAQPLLHFRRKPVGAVDACQREAKGSRDRCIVLSQFHQQLGRSSWPQLLQSFGTEGATACLLLR
jgi:hypothetical protein